ncbi:MAG: T9SS type A sorting domain-containing protein [FCB group bacterium]|nr:T9SS type A sorting domain-containing protein [FCB group bacterium]MBL7028026.1 T9SS type A sorting domain-containing protein [Candidatus Neomarinimicrobiota bacterium]MBL7122458.1 T9SS type A sorting domain-containing protein [Candidatus Neomarinimicrobiota bacterium]
MHLINKIFILSVCVSGLSAQSLPTETSTLFSGSGACAVCHTQAGPNTAALRDSHGKDVSPTTYWRSTMMANAAIDPLWQAKVQAEIAANPQLQSVIEDKCTSCHAPMGNTQAGYDGQPDYTIAEMLESPLGMDGVSCAVCHQIQDQDLGQGESFSGHFTIEDSRLIYGPFSNPVVGPMATMANYTPTMSPHISKSELCATCHTLFTPYVNDEGEVVGEAPEQVPYLEWLNSDYPELGIECQTCHMPAIEENIVLSNRPQWLGSRNPLHTHEFVGGNVFMLKMLKNFGDELGVTASEAHFDSTIDRSMRLLERQSVRLNLTTDWNVMTDSLTIEVDVENLSGHKFPTAYPSRRAWLEIKVEDQSGNIVFHSGAWDETGEIIELDPGYEQHRQSINDQDQVQIYQNIPRDVNSDKTYTLLRIAGYLKDNRIPPVGYLSGGIAADSTSITGLATQDPDFNRNGLEEGTGSDKVHYRVGGLNPNESYHIGVTMNYQTIAPRFAQDLFEYDLPEVDEFQSYYDQMDLSPIPVAIVGHTISTSGIRTQTPESQLLVEAYPNPFNPETNIQVSLPGDGDINLNIFDIQGKQVTEIQSINQVSGLQEYAWDGKDSQGRILEAGIYLVQVEFREMGSPIALHADFKIVLLK